MVDTESCNELFPGDSSGLETGTKAYSDRYCNSLCYANDYTKYGNERVKCCFIDIKKDKNNHYRGCLKVKARELDNIDDFIKAMESGVQGNTDIDTGFYDVSALQPISGFTVKVLDCSSSYIYTFLLISLLLLF